MEIDFREPTREDTSPILTETDRSLVAQLPSMSRKVVHEWNTGTAAFGTRMFCAFDPQNNRMIGIVILLLTPSAMSSRAWITEIMVDNAYRGRGIGDRLMQMAEDESRSSGAPSINLTSHPDETVLVSLCERRGYKPHGRMVLRKLF